MQHHEKTMKPAGDIRSRRIELGIAQKSLAEKANLSLSELSRIERGFKRPSVEQIKRLAQAFNVSAEELAADQASFIKSATPGEGYTTVRADQTRNH